jgi:hypothetical protein
MVAYVGDPSCRAKSRRSGLAFDDGSVDVFFSERVIEHVPFVGGAQFLRESYRAEVMTAVGFRDVQRRLPGEGLRADYCIERRRRGIYLGYESQEELLPRQDVFDAESFVAEALK